MNESKTMATTKMLLPVKLTEHEVAERAREIGGIQREAEDLEAKAKAAASQAKDTIRGLKAKLRDLVGVVYSGVENREVEVSELHEYRTGVVRTVRADTGETVSERAMFSHERQGTLPIDESTPALHDGDEAEPEPPASGDVTDPQTVLDAEPKGEAEAEGRVVRRRRGKKADA